MGLDIIAVRNAKPVKGCRTSDCSMEHQKLTVDKTFMEVADGLADGSCWTAMPHDIFEFRAGSYSGYNEWREMLSQAMLGVSPEMVWTHAKKFKAKPFYELINFADCEGTIGATTSKKLNDDFLSHMAQARKVSLKKGDSYFYEKFIAWEKAFAMAADGGFVRFH